MNKNDKIFGFSRLSNHLIAGVGLASAFAVSPTFAAMDLAGQGLAPKAFYKFCKQDPGNCNSTSGAKVIHLTAALRKQLSSVNSAVNRSIREASDIQTRGVEDDWRIGVGVGDCEDFAIAKKDALRKRGWPASALLLTVARDDFGQGGHTVLTVRTTKGDLILDNRTRSVKNWTRTSYRYYARQSQSTTGKWERIAG